MIASLLAASIVLASLVAALVSQPATSLDPRLVESTVLATDALRIGHKHVIQAVLKTTPPGQKRDELTAVLKALDVNQK